MPDPLLLEGWPALLTHEMAARYLSLDGATFTAVAEQFRIYPVAPAPGCERWRRSDLDRMIRRLDTKPLVSTKSSSSTHEISLDRDTVRQLADVIEQGLRGYGGRPSGEYLSIRDVVAEFSISRSSVYKLIGTGKIEVRRLAGRTLIIRSSVEKLLK